jgi:hypothetical protein
MASTKKKPATKKTAKPKANSSFGQKVLKGVVYGVGVPTLAIVKANRNVGRKLDRYFGTEDKSLFLRGNRYVTSKKNPKKAGPLTRKK